jgi:hypothetical protein
MTDTATERTRRWREAHPETRREHDRRYREANRDKVRESKRRYREAHREEIREAGRRSYEANSEAALESQRRYRERCRAQVFGHYGWACECCGATENLTIDHVNGDGKQHREELFGRNGGAGTAQFYAWLIREGFPDGYQALCRSCNTSKGSGESCILWHG